MIVLLVVRGLGPHCSAVEEGFVFDRALKRDRPMYNIRPGNRKCFHLTRLSGGDPPLCAPENFTLCDCVLRSTVMLPQSFLEPLVLLGSKLL